MDVEYSISIAENGQEGINAAFELIPDIIISDVMMPLVSGIELTRELKQDLRTSHIPIILLTAKTDLESRLEGFSGGADAYLSKPFNKTELSVRLKSILKLREALKSRYSQNFSPEKDDRYEKEDQFITQLQSFIDANLQDEDLSVSSLISELGLSERPLQKKLKALTGMSPVSYILWYRIEKAKELLLDSQYNISEIAYTVGFKSPAYFTRVFTKSHRCSPSSWRAQKMK